MTTEAAAPAGPKRSRAWKDLTPEERAERTAKMQAGRKKAPAATTDPRAAAAIAGMTGAAPTGSELVTGEACWFETNLDIVADVKRGRPERIFSSEDPRWDDFPLKKKMAVGSLVVGTVTRLGEEFVPNTLKVRHVIAGCGWEKARDKMKRWEQEGRMWDTPKADLVREHADAVKQGQRDQADAIASALKEFAKDLRR